MNIENLKKLRTHLTSGKYLHGTGQLEKMVDGIKHHCCIGVAGQEYQEEYDPSNLDVDTYRWFQKWLNINKDEMVEFYDTNDGNLLGTDGKSYDKVVKLIDKHIKQEEKANV